MGESMTVSLGIRKIDGRMLERRSYVSDDDAATESSGALVLVDVQSSTAAVLARAAVSGTLTVLWR